MVALTVTLARIQVSKDMGDDFRGTTTAGGSTTTFVDDLLANFDDDNFVNKFDTFVLATSGTNANLWRRVTSKSGATATCIAFPNTFDTSVTYEVHRIVTPAVKDDAVTHALNILNGTTLFKKAQADITWVADQFDYNVPSGFYRNQIRQIHLVSTGDTEITREIFDWEPRVDSGGGDDIHFYSRLAAGDKLRCFGHQVVAISDLVDGDGFSLILSARAAMYVYETVIANAPTEHVERYKSLLAIEQARFNERVAKFTEIGIPFSALTQVYRSGSLGRDFGV